MNFPTYTVKVRANRTYDMAGLFDMLRYDRATVETWDRDRDEEFVLTLRAPRFTLDRWHSFGLYPVEVVR